MKIILLVAESQELNSVSDLFAIWALTVDSQGNMHLHTRLEVKTAIGRFIGCSGGWSKDAPIHY